MTSPSPQRWQRCHSARACSIRNAVRACRTSGCLPSFFYPITYYFLAKLRRWPYLFRPQKRFPMDGLNLVSRQRHSSFEQQPTELRCSLALFRWLKLSKLSLLAGWRKHCKVCSGGKKSALSGKSERRVAWPPPLPPPRYNRFSLQ